MTKFKKIMLLQQNTFILNLTVGSAILAASRRNDILKQLVCRYKPPLKAFTVQLKVNKYVLKEVKDPINPGSLQ